MSRHRSAGSYGHAIRRIGADHYRLFWTVDRYYADSQLRHPRISQKDTDTDGAKRFAQRWNVKMPESAS